ncbi:MAG: ABC transporter permease [Synergistaceae bacterium]|jgi:ribose/xylose/arabinose/galactoside ABC-type transport system permease subunit|nr:ABC transporter permease [Synergistaceae bacterium]
MSKSTRQNLMLLAVLAAMFIFFTCRNARFASLYNLTNMFRQSLPNLILGCASMFVIASGGIDLSVGGTMALSALFYGYLCLWGVNAWLAIPIVGVLGAFVGAANAFIMEKLKIPGIMATLATWIITSGMAFMVCRAIPLNDPLLKPVVILNSMKFFGSRIPLAIPIVIAVAAMFLFLERYTVLGKYAIAIGGNELAAYYSGIAVVKIRMIFFVLSGVMAALSGIWQVARLGSADPTIGTGMEFNVLTACILGGVNIKGGEGTMTGTLLGALILMVLLNGMQMMGVDSFFQSVATGAALYIAVFLNTFMGRLRMNTRTSGV